MLRWRGALFGLALLLRGSAAPAAGPEELLRFGHALRREGRQSEARHSYARATELHPRHAGGWFELAESQQAVNELDGALASFRAGLRLRPSADGQQSAFGVALQGAGRLSEARAAYRRAIARAPTDAEAHFNLGTALEADG